MNSLLKSKFDELVNAEKFECWYLVKQQTSFVDVCYLVHFLEKFKNEHPSQNLENFIKDEVTKFNSEFGLNITTVHRCLLVASYYGLITKTAEKGSNYEDCEITSVYYEIESRCNGKFENTDLYKDIIQRQIEKIYITTPIDDQYQGTRKDFKIYPVIFLYKILLELGIATGNYSITVSEYDYLVDTAKSYDDFLEILLSIQLYREDKSAQAEFEENLSGKFDNRMKLAFKQLDTLVYNGNSISLRSDKIQEVQNKVFLFETNRSKFEGLNKLETLQSDKDIFNISNQTISTSHLSNNPTAYTNPKQIIFYGVPGCGKSHKISELLEDKKAFSINSKEEQVIRTVFHPDYTNSDFVGQIFPEQNNSKIEYKFKAGPFTEILTRALLHPENQYVLVIEEINRGNSASIFGEIFQLLDRIETGDTKTVDGVNKFGKGWSEYFFMNDSINEYVRKKASLSDKTLTEVNVNGIIFTPNTGIRLPPNLSLLATMNTSDQNVYTLDNAFQRRWNMEYISNKVEIKADTPAEIKKQFELKIGETEISWGKFREEINKEISNPENSFSNAEDKQLGLFFIKAENDKINEKDFSNKVLKYLWNDIFKREKYVFNEKVLTFGDLLDSFKGTEAFVNSFSADFVSKITE